MTLSQQRKAFDLELHALINRFLEEFDLPPEALLDLIISEEMYLIAMAFARVEEEEATDEDRAARGEWVDQGDDDDEELTPSS